VTDTKVKRYVAGGTTRCVQAAFRMVVETLVGIDPGQERADVLTGYVEGRGTWQFRMLLALADLQLHVVDHELFDFRKFTIDPAGAIEDQVKEDHIAKLILAETDVAAEVDAVKRCLLNPNIELVNSRPSFEDLCEQVSLGRLVMCNVNLQVLEGKAEREGHILLVERVEDNLVVAHDPGPHGGLARRFDRNLFLRAWRSPSDAMANYISVRTTAG
jgi:hypothetical protein